MACGRGLSRCLRTLLDTPTAVAAFWVGMGRLMRRLCCALLALPGLLGACGPSGDDTASVPPGAGGSVQGDAGADRICVPLTCEQAGAECGTMPDSCGGTRACGACAPGTECGGRGPNLCGGAACVPLTCAEIGAGCGSVSDGCGKVLDCGGCQAPDSCGGAGKANECGCAPKTCAQLNASCGSVEDGCGHNLGCGDCPEGIYCGASGVPNQCGCACTLPHASTTCGDGGVCSIVSCDPGWGDCDHDDSNGCEVDLQSSPSSCGACGVSCDDGNACTLGDACQSGTCTPGAPNSCSAPPNAECYLPNGTCNPTTGACSYQPRPDGTSCTDGYCCGAECVPKSSKAHCGSCGIDCGAGSCVKISGASQYSCTCTGGDAYCKSAGFGSAATCYNYGGQYLCDCQCSGSSSCTGQCAGGGTCTEVMGHNYCHY